MRAERADLHALHTRDVPLGVLFGRRFVAAVSSSSTSTMRTGRAGSSRRPSSTSRAVASNVSACAVSSSACERKLTACIRSAAANIIRACPSISSPMRSSSAFRSSGSITAVSSCSGTAQG
jgi:hypothetical protein